MGLPAVETEKGFAVGVAIRPETEDDRFLRYRKQGGILPRPIYSQVRKAAEQAEQDETGVGLISRPTRLQAEHMMERIGLDDRNEDVIGVYRILRKNSDGVFNKPEKPDGNLEPVGEDRLHDWTQIPGWCDQRVFAETLLVMGRSEERRAFMARYPNIFTHEAEEHNVGER